MSRSLLRQLGDFVDLDDSSNFIYWKQPLDTRTGGPMVHCRKRVLPSPEVSDDPRSDDQGGYYEYFDNDTWIRCADRYREAMSVAMGSTSALITLRRVYRPGAIVRLLVDYCRYRAGDLMRVRSHCFSDSEAVVWPNVYAAPLHALDTDDSMNIGPYWWRLALFQHQPTQNGRVLHR